MRIGIDGRRRWIWTFPGSERELWGEWADRFAPLHLDPTWSTEPRDFLGRLSEVDTLPDDLDGHIELGARPRLVIGRFSAWAGQERRKDLADDPVFGPLLDDLDRCPHEVVDGALVHLTLSGGLRRSVARAALRHPCLRGLRTLEVGEIPRLDADAVLAALLEGGPLPELTRLRWFAPVDALAWNALRRLAPALETLELAGSAALDVPPPPLRRVRAARVGDAPADAGPADLTVWSFDAGSEPGWWHHVQSLRLERVPGRRATLTALAALEAPRRLRALALPLAPGVALLAPAIVTLFDAWPDLQLLTLGTKAVARAQVDSLRRTVDPMPPWEPAPLREVLSALGYTLRPPVPEDELEALEDELDVRLPEPYRDFVLRFGDGGAGPGFGLESVRDPETREGRVHEPFDPTRERHRLDGTLRLCDHGCDRVSLIVLSGPDAGTVWLDDRSAGTLTPHEVPEGCDLGFRAWYLDWLETALGTA